MEAADALNGYASGSSLPAFIIRSGSGWRAGLEPEEVYEDTLLHFLASAGKKARGKEESVSAYDEICAFSHGEGSGGPPGKEKSGDL